MTEYQQRIFDALKRGAKLQWEISGFYYRHKLLRVETAGALIGTGELARVRLEGRLSMGLDYIVHESQVETVSAAAVAVGKKVLGVEVPFLYGKVRK